MMRLGRLRRCCLRMAGAVPASWVHQVSLHPNSVSNMVICTNSCAVVVHAEAVSDPEGQEAPEDATHLLLRCENRVFTRSWSEHHGVDDRLSYDPSVCHTMLREGSRLWSLYVDVKRVLDRVSQQLLHVESISQKVRKKLEGGTRWVCGRSLQSRRGAHGGATADAQGAA